MDNRWTDQVVGERMTVDKEFTQDVLNSEFTNQEWDLIMSAVEFEIENPDSPEEARIVANTEKVATIVPELDDINAQMQAMGGAPGGGSRNRGNGGGIVDSVKSALGMGGGDGDGDPDQERIEAASELAARYGEELQEHLESKGRWAEICAVAARSPAADEN
ncbi:DUF5799 family protein [Haloarchaeobius litoreus]|uniref:DUF5799 family protein n=1 Tax=Haloarchaeobius litoreus TaxID=755306 RepID=A0ABD6DL28_9EURY|nr:DUF5799 family protein [Haloarchaeobius litoreus]